MPNTTEQYRKESARRIRAHMANAAPYPHPGMLATKSNGLPVGWRWCANGEDVHRELNGWVCVVRVAQDAETGPFVAVGRKDGQGQWFRWEGHRTLEDAIAKADEVMG